MPLLVRLPIFTDAVRNATLSNCKEPCPGCRRQHQALVSQTPSVNERTNESVYRYGVYGQTSVWNPPHGVPEAPSQAALTSLQCATCK